MKGITLHYFFYMNIEGNSADGLVINFVYIPNFSVVTSKRKLRKFTSLKNIKETTQMPNMQDFRIIISKGHMKSII